MELGRCKFKTDEGIHLYWPRSYRRGNSSKGEDPLVYDQKNYNKQVEELKQYLIEAKTFQAERETKNLPHAALAGAFSGAQQVYLHAKEKDKILDGIDLLKKQGIQRIVLVGGDDAHLYRPTEEAGYSCDCVTSASFTQYSRRRCEASI